MKKDGFWWKIYFLLFSSYVIFSVQNIISPRSFLFIYHHTLIAFDSAYNFPYLLVVFRTIFNVINLIPLFLCVFEIPYGNFRTWQWLFILRAAFDLTGHGGEIQHLKAIYYLNKTFFIMTLVFFSCLILPAYYACFQYAFRWRKIFKDQ